MRTTQKTLVLLAMLVCIVAALVVCASASDTEFDYTGVAGVKKYVNQPGYDDIYYSKVEGQTTIYGNWLQVATNETSKKNNNGDGAYNALGDIH